MKTDKMQYINYADIESLIKKFTRCINNPEKSSTAKIWKHVPCGYSISIIWEFDHIERKHSSCMEVFCISFTERGHAKFVIDIFLKKACCLEQTNTVTSIRNSTLHL